MNRILIILGCLLLSACQSTVNTVEKKEKHMQRDRIDTSKVDTDDLLKKRLIIKRIDEIELPGGYLKVQVTAKNLRTSLADQIGAWFIGDDPYQIFYRFSWLDKNGMAMKMASQRWTPLKVVPGNIVRFSTIAPNPRCKDFTLILRDKPKLRMYKESFPTKTLFETEEKSF